MESSQSYRSRVPFGYIPKVHTNTSKKKVQANSKDLDDFVLEAVQKIPPINPNSNFLKGSASQPDLRPLREKLQNQIKITKDQDDLVSDEDSYEVDVNFNKDLLDNQIVESIEKYKRKKEKAKQEYMKMKKDYVKSDIMKRVDRYKKKVLYEELKLREIEVRNSLSKKEHRLNVDENQKQQQQQQQQESQRNIENKCPSVPYSSTAQFNNMSEKERFIKISFEFNKLKSQLEANKYQDYEQCLMYLQRLKIGLKFEPSRQQVKHFMRFVKNENREFDLNKNLEEIIQEILDEGQNQYDTLMDSPPHKKRSQTAGPVHFPRSIMKEAKESHTKRFVDMLSEQYKLLLIFYSPKDHGTNYEVWNEKFEFDYNQVPKDMPLEGPYRRARKRRNQLKYMRKIPHAFAPKTISRIMSEYIDDNKKLEAKEFFPPSLSKEFSNAINFNKETVNTVMNFAQESRQRLLASMSTNNLEKGKEGKEGPVKAMQMPKFTTKQTVTSILSPKAQNPSFQIQDQQKNMQGQTSMKFVSSESESVYKRNKLMLEHVMLERAVKRMNSRQQKRDGSKPVPRVTSNDWKLRRQITNDVQLQQREAKTTSWGKRLTQK